MTSAVVHIPRGIRNSKLSGACQIIEFIPALDGFYRTSSLRIIRDEFFEGHRIQNSPTQGVGPQALTLFNQANLDLAQVRKVIAVADYERTIQQAFREIADSLAARDTLAGQIEAQEAAQRSQDDRLRIVDARYRAGASSYLEVLDAQRDAYAARQATVQVRRAFLSSAVQLYKALGGGQ